VRARSVVQLSDRLTYWTAPHPNWRPNPEWPKEVGCVAYSTPNDLVLIDPLVRNDLSSDVWDWFDDAVEAAHGKVAVLLTAPWHERSTRDIVERYGAAVWIDSAARVRTDGLPKLQAIPAGIEVFTPRGVSEGQVAFFIEEERTLVVAEFFLGTPTGLRLLPSPTTNDIHAFTESMNELRRLPIDRVLLAHGPPVFDAGADAIAAALDAFAEDHRA
jgi:glyoxylase-like metal-dependent hydrolase (beta-lactamase superfamily II)